ncbi:uncharacterized protein RJT20DRAFT_127774 [Scheffersomyces xylosifermentans]|uniref:uncharacterized protein n=1 Tax=Scheffersomyces xylosifermentans TaxID=1304137 RepID=UPI00315D101D
MVDFETILITLVAALAINYIYNQYINSTKDVNELYLNEQSTIDSTRLSNESAVYKSNKLGYASGLRIGLDIRYDHYKLRHGNLSDVWQVITRYAAKQRGKGITINDRFQPILQLNYKIDKFRQYLLKKEAKTVRINLRHFINNFDVLIIIISAFVSQVTVELYDDIAYLSEEDEKNALYIVDYEDLKKIQVENYFNFEDQSIYDLEASDELSEFENEYTFEKDKGIALKITRRLNNTVLSTVEYTQLNIISSLAASIKHLPLSKEINYEDKLMVIQFTSEKKKSNEELTNQLNKILISFITNADLIILEKPNISWSTIFDYKPTILSISEKDLQKLSLDNLKKDLHLNWYKKFIFNQSLKFLSKGKFTKNDSINPYSKLRLVYVNNTITNPRIFSSPQLNEFRALLASRLIMEFGYYNIMGPVILTDFYDYRFFELKNLKSWGCISQSLELKLTGINEKKEGKLAIRGYSIGKSTNRVINRTDEVEQNKDIMKANDGFMPLTNVNGVWGNDGCLYVI